MNKKSYFSRMLILYSMFLSPLSLEIGRITAPLPQRKLQNGLEFPLEMLVAQLTEVPLKHFNTRKFKI